MTQWGAILVYFGMPSWVKDCNESLVEEESDAEDVKALKVSSKLQNSSSLV